LFGATQPKFPTTTLRLQPHDGWDAHIGSSCACEAQSDSKNTSKLSLAWNRRNGVSIGMTFSSAFSFMARFACTIGIGGLDDFVTKPERNHGDIHAALKQGHRGAVANHKC